MKRVVAMLSVMAVMVAVLATPAFAAPLSLGFKVVCPNYKYTLEVDPQRINNLFPGYFADLNKKLVQGDCEAINRYTPLPPLP